MNENLNPGDLEQRPSLSAGALTAELDHRSNGKNLFIRTTTFSSNIRLFFNVKFKSLFEGVLN